MAVEPALPSTRERLLEAATETFATRGYEATSLDELAILVGVRKQTLLYYYPSKDALLVAVIEHGVGELAASLRPAHHRRHGHGDEAFVAAVFRLGTERPALIDLVREVLRLGPPAASTLTTALEPLVEELSAALADRSPEAARRMVLEAAAMVVGMATEVEVLRAVGQPPTVAALRRRRRILLEFLRRP